MLRIPMKFPNYVHTLKPLKNNEEKNDGKERSMNKSTPQPRGLNNMGNMFKAMKHVNRGGCGSCRGTK